MRRIVVAPKPLYLKRLAAAAKIASRLCADFR